MIPPTTSEMMGLSSLPPDGFKYCLTLFPKSFASFVHTTCSLSVSEQYLAFAEVYLRLQTAIPNCPTLLNRKTSLMMGVGTNGAVTLHDVPFQKTLPYSTSLFSHPIAPQVGGFAFAPPLSSALSHSPVHSPLLRGSRLFSFPPLIDMLKFSG